MRSLLAGIIAASLPLQAMADIDSSVTETLAADPLSEVIGASYPAGVRPLSRPATERAEEEPRQIVYNGVSVTFGEPPVLPPVRSTYQPAAKWDETEEGELWTRTAMAAIEAHGDGLEDIIPSDIEAWCPGYANKSDEERRAFWVGMMSALAYYESRYVPHVVGGGGQWFGLLQIYPTTARHYDCYASTGEALKDPVDNLSCAVRIMAYTVERDNAIAGGRRGVAADWGPMTHGWVIDEMTAWTREQDYCTSNAAVMVSLRPEMRPEQVSVPTFSTMSAPAYYE
ncbi:transglycosylase SLT domain-containing protein [Pelagovum pacificum]|nr:transglycosylase SLT domain-containing protein [Pelagovum pacificum]